MLKMKLLTENGGAEKESEYNRDLQEKLLVFQLPAHKCGTVLLV